MSVTEILRTSTGLHTLLGANDAEVDEEGNVRVSLKIGVQHQNPAGTAHGGVIASLCEIALGCQQALQNIEGAALDSEIHYYRPGLLGSTLTAAVRPRKLGRTVSTYLIEVTDESGTRIADMLATTFTKNS